MKGNGYRRSNDSCISGVTPRPFISRDRRRNSGLHVVARNNNKSLRVSRIIRLAAVARVMGGGRLVISDSMCLHSAMAGIPFLYGATTLATSCHFHTSFSAPFSRAIALSFSFCPSFPYDSQLPRWPIASRRHLAFPPGETTAADVPTKFYRVAGDMEARSGLSTSATHSGIL